MPTGACVVRLDLQYDDEDSVDLLTPQEKQALIAPQNERTIPNWRAIRQQTGSTRQPPIKNPNPIKSQYPTESCSE
jgi:hypothetical protein